MTEIIKKFFAFAKFLDALREGERYQLCFSDIEMPGMDGRPCRFKSCYPHGKSTNRENDAYFRRAFSNHGNDIVFDKHQKNSFEGNAAVDKLKGNQ